MIERLLTQLNGVKQTGPDKWVACCPSHNDKTPSLSIKRIDDRILIHCFAGCDPLSVVQTLGLSLVDLFACNLNHSKPFRRHRKRIDYRKAFALARHEALVIALAAGDLARGKELSEGDSQAVLRALANLNHIAGREDR